MKTQDMVLVSVDDHVVEPPHLFEGRLPAKYVDLAPKFITRSDGSNAWVYEGNEISNVALNAVSGRPREEYGIEPGAYLNPWAAGVSSLVAFTVGALLPLLGMALFGVDVRVAATFAAVLVALVVTGYVSARLGGAAVARAVVRNVVGGALAMAVTYGIGLLIGGAVG